MNEHRPAASTEAILALAYCGLYFALQLVRLEGEGGHWGSLVALPLAGLVWLRRERGLGTALRDALASVGLRWGRLARGLVWAIPLGLALSLLQLLISRQREAFLALIDSGRAFVFFPLAFVFLLLTAGFTEEFFFRGVIQTRLERWSGSRFVAIAAAALLFALYHFPYAWLHPAWPTAGDAGAALRVSLVEGIPAGIVLGLVFRGSGNNLVAAAVTHALIDVFPVMPMIHMGGD